MKRSRVKPLFELGIKSFCLSLEDASVIERLPIPQLIQSYARAVVKQLWLAESPPISPEDYDYSGVNLAHMTRVEFNMIWNYPIVRLGIPEFLPEVCHIVWRYYEVGRYRICRFCFRFISQLSFTTTWYHYCLGADVVMTDVVQKTYNYCDLCVKQSLYEIVDRDERFNFNHYGFF